MGLHERERAGFFIIGFPAREPEEEKSWEKRSVGSHLPGSSLQSLKGRGEMGEKERKEETYRKNMSSVDSGIPSCPGSKKERI